MRDNNKSVADDWSVGAEATRLEALSTAARKADEMCIIELLSMVSVRGLERENEKEGGEEKKKVKYKGTEHSRKHLPQYPSFVPCGNITLL